MTGLIAAVLTGAGIGLVAFGTLAALAVADTPAAVAVGAWFAVTALLGACAYFIREYWRFRRQFRLPSLRHCWLRAVAVRSEKAIVRAAWTPEDRVWLEGFEATLPGTRGRRR